MIYLLIAALIWSFSFGLIKTTLFVVDPSVIACLRLMIACGIFLPFFKTRGLNFKLSCRLLFLGAIQFGLTYCLYLKALKILTAYETALFVIFVPFYVTAIDGFYQKRFVGFSWLMAAMGVIGAAVIRYETTSFSDVLYGFCLMQMSNFCFAFGQIDYKYLRRRHPALDDARSYALPLLGGMLLSGFASIIWGRWSTLEVLSHEGWIALVYLGVMASGVSFYCWNKGALSVPTGTLALMGVLKIPLAVACALLFFGETTDIPRLLFGGGIILTALVVSEKYERKRFLKVTD
jgi:drug/metabolite transporter (DMT)-like permease